MGKLGITKAAKKCEGNKHCTGSGRDLNKTNGPIEKRSIKGNPTQQGLREENQ